VRRARGQELASPCHERVSPKMAKKKNERRRGAEV
jgi:hypothetical protein